jgi:hypothetical protein
MRGPTSGIVAVLPGIDGLFPVERVGEAPKSASQVRRPSDAGRRRTVAESPDV